MSFAHVQGLATHGVITGANTFVATLGANVGSGNCVLGGIISVPNGITITSVQDDQGNTYTVKDSLNDATDSHQIFSFELGNITNAPHIITITFGSGSGNPVQVVIDEYSGALAVADPTDGHAIVLRTAPGTGANAITSTSITTTANGDLIYGICFDQGTATPASTAGTSPLPFTLRGSDLDTVDAFSVVSEDAVQSVAGSVNAAFTNSTTGGGDNFAVIIMAVKPAAVSGGISLAKHNFKVDKFKTPQRSMGPNAGLFQVKAFPIVAAGAQVDSSGQTIYRVRNNPWRW